MMGFALLAPAHAEGASLAQPIYNHILHLVGPHRADALATATDFRWHF